MPDIVAPIIPNVKFDPEIFVSAFQRALANKQKRAQLEYQINRMSQQQALSEQRMELQDKYHTQQAQAASDRLGVSEERLGFQKEVNDYKDKRQAESDAAEEKIVTGLNNIKAEKGTPEYWNEVSGLIGDNAHGLRGKIAPKLIMEATGDHLKAKTTADKLFNNLIKNEGFTSYDPFEHPYQDNDPANPWKKKVNADGTESYFTMQGNERDPTDTTGTKFRPKYVTMSKDKYEERMATFDQLFPGRGTGRPSPKMEKELDATTARAIRDKIRSNNPSISNEQLSAQIGQVARSQGYTVP